MVIADSRKTSTGNYSNTTNIYNIQMSHFLYTKNNKKLGKSIRNPQKNNYFFSLAQQLRLLG